MRLVTYTVITTEICQTCQRLKIRYKRCNNCSQHNKRLPPSASQPITSSDAQIAENFPSSNSPAHGVGGFIERILTRTSSGRKPCYNFPPEVS